MIDADEDASIDSNSFNTNLRNARMTINFSELWKLNFLPQLVKRLKLKCVNLNQIRIRMLCRRFSNVEETLDGLVSELMMKSITSRDVASRSCDYSKLNKDEDGVCLFKGRCRECYVVYKVECTMCKKSYISNTQNHLKRRT